MSGEAPSTQQIPDQMRSAMGEVPAAIEKAAGADPRMVAEQARSSAFAMPPEDGVLDAETRTFIYLTVALATSNRACTMAMVNKARKQEIATAKLLAVVNCAPSDVMATRVTPHKSTSSRLCRWAYPASPWTLNDR